MYNCRVQRNKMIMMEKILFSNNRNVEQERHK